MKLVAATELAQVIVRRLEPYCERIDVAGDVRRQVDPCQAIDLVAIPIVSPSLIGDEPRPIVCDEIDALVREGTLDEPKMMFRRLSYRLYDRSTYFHLSFAGASNYGLVWAFLTGPRPFALQLITSRERQTPDKRPGLLPAGYDVTEAHIWHCEQMLETPDEETVFRIIDRPYRLPWERR